jgi:NAD(P)-dependent dehydrogenase (short-subunit alcohol dehydrogenase family)
VTIISSNQAKLDAALKQLKSPNVKGVVSDVRDEAAYTKTLLGLAPVDHVVFSAVDNIIRGKLVDQSLDDAKHLFGVKFWGAVTTGKIVLKYDIIRSGGSLTLTSGTAGLRPGKNAAIGGALNGGVLSLTSGLAADLAEKKIRVNTVVPGLVKTPLWDKQGKTPQEQEELFEASSRKLPVGFVATPEHIAEAYLYAIRADYTTGKLIEIGECQSFAEILGC